ncbi:hypothetical protein LEMLEM_LOCUS4717 [Lemmus lemmus]
MSLIPELGGKVRRISVSLRPAWSTRASSRTGTKATLRNPVTENKFCLEQVRVGCTSHQGSFSL